MSERLIDLDPIAKRRAVTLATVRVLALAVAVFGVYYLVPVSTFGGDHVLLALGLGSLLFATVVVTQLRRIERAKHPAVRAAETLGLVIPVFLILFASIYLSLSETVPGNFSEALNHTDSLYFTVTVFATVGFGDVAPVTAVARLLTSSQMLLDLVVLSAVVRIVTSTARRRIQTP